MSKEVDTEGSQEDAWIQKPEFLVPRFNTVHTLVQKQVENKDINLARENYQRLLGLYDEINRSSIRPQQKQESYTKLMDVFGALSNPDNLQQGSSFLTIGKYLFPVSLIVIVLIIVIFARPEFSLSGLAVFEENTAPKWVGGNPEFDIIGRTTINLDTYFKDSFFDNIEYIVASSPNLDISLDDNLLTIKAEYGIQGVRVLNIIASDGEERTRVTATLNIH